ncbi:hypothetical protein HanRHA438_Chr07g0289691 [Helianthus annuus]|nr:hypothetical protein HanRHA438_Chr07g0289691 [Helianthus annuus]
MEIGHFSLMISKKPYFESENDSTHTQDSHNSIHVKMKNAESKEKKLLSTLGSLK